jgi:hypothetical protein
LSVEPLFQEKKNKGYKKWEKLSPQKGPPGRERRSKFLMIKKTQVVPVLVPV